MRTEASRAGLKRTVVTTNTEAVYEAIQKVKAMRSIRREAHES